VLVCHHGVRSFHAAR